MNAQLGFLYFIIMFLIIIAITQSKKKIIIRKKNTIEVKKMKTSLELLIGKYVVVKSIEGSEFGNVSSVTDGALILIENDNTKVINLEYIISASEFPQKVKKNKKKAEEN